jgi:3-carboxy-cis,cis-muconate cycloisomerase
MKPSSSTSDRGLTAALFGDSSVERCVDDEAFIRAMLDAEAALALAGADVGAVPDAAAASIAATCAELDVDVAALGTAAMPAGNPVVPLVAQLRESADDEAKTWVHHGATSQDILDTALMEMSRHAGRRILELLAVAASSCAELAAEHRDTMMVARTLGQQAAPTTFGRKAAGWLLGLADATDRLSAVCERRLAAQLGGPVGTLAAYGDAGPAVVAAFAKRIGLPAPVLPWHTDRQRVIELAAALGGAAAAADKIATDLLLMTQNEVGEVRFAAGGGSSSMPHKHNPVDAVLVRAGAIRAPGLVATLLAAGSPEHERATGAWHAEWQPWRELLSVVGGIAGHTAAMLAGVRVDAGRMRSNLDAAGGVVMADNVARSLADVIGRGRAQDVVARCVVDAEATGRTFADVLLADPEVAGVVDAGGVAAALDPALWLGSAAAMVDIALRHHRDHKAAQ